jgi:hypothetical protein
VACDSGVVDFLEGCHFACSLVRDHLLSSDVLPSLIFAQFNIR